MLQSTSHAGITGKIPSDGKNYWYIAPAKKFCGNGVHLKYGNNFYKSKKDLEAGKVYNVTLE